MKRIRIVFLTLFCCLWWGTTGFSQTFSAQLSAADEILAASTLHDTLEYNRTGVVTTWRNPDSQVSGTSQSLKTFKTAGGAHCREFQQSVVIAGRQADAYGTACRQADGHWKIVSTNLGNPLPARRVVAQTARKASPGTTYSSSYYPAWFYPGYLLLGFSLYDDHHSEYRSGKHRGYIHRHSSPYRGKERLHKWNRKHEWFGGRGWDGHRGRGRGGHD